MWFYLALSFALGSSFYSLLVKKVSQRFSILTLVFLLFVFNLPFTLLLLISSGPIPTVTPRFFELVLVATILDTIGIFASMRAVQLAPISLIAPFSAFTPLLTTIFASVFLGESFTVTKFGGVILIVFGTYLLDISEIKNGYLSPFKKILSNKAIQLALVSNIIWSFSPLFQKPAIFETSPQTPLFPSLYELALMVLFVSPVALIHIYRNGLNLKGSWKVFAFLGFMSALMQMISFTTFALTNVGYASAIFKLSTLFSILFGKFVLKEEKVRERLIGAAVMLLGTFLLVT